MNKQLFNNLLKDKLSLYLAKSEIDKAVFFFNEIIDDKMEDGMSEELAIKSLGNIDTVVDQILKEHNIKRRKTKMVWRFIPTGMDSIVGLIIAVVTFPIWFPLLLLSMVPIVVVLSVTLSILSSGIFILVKVPFLLYTHTLPDILFATGLGFISLGLGLLLTWLIIKLIKHAKKQNWSLAKIFKKEVFIDE